MANWRRARQSSRRALEIDPSNFGAQQLLKSIQHEMPREERLAAPAGSLPQRVQAPAPVVTELRSEPARGDASVRTGRLPPAPMRTTPPSPARQAVEENVPEMIFAPEESVSSVTDSLKVTPAVPPLLPVPAVRPEATPVAPVSTPVPVPPLASAAVALPTTAPVVAAVAHDTPAISTTHSRLRLSPSASGGCAAARHCARCCSGCQSTPSRGRKAAKGTQNRGRVECAAY